MSGTIASAAVMPRRSPVTAAKIAWRGTNPRSRPSRSSTGNSCWVVRIRPEDMPSIPSSGDSASYAVIIAARAGSSRAMSRSATSELSAAAATKTKTAISSRSGLPVVSARKPKRKATAWPA
jgi:hypothetical protein